MMARGAIARIERPISRWISWVRPDWRPRADSRAVRDPVEPGSMPYSEVIQPFPLLRIQLGTPVSIDAVQMTRVFPTSISADPLACLMKLGVMRTGRNSLG